MTRANAQGPDTLLRPIRKNPFADRSNRPRLAEVIGEQEDGLLAIHSERSIAWYSPVFRRINTGPGSLPMFSMEWP
jgi:hypothetical protein